MFLDSNIVQFLYFSGQEHCDVARSWKDLHFSLNELLQKFSGHLLLKIFPEFRFDFKCTLSILPRFHHIYQS